MYRNNLGKVVTINLEYYDEKLEHQMFKKLEWVEGLEVDNKTLKISYKPNGYTNEIFEVETKNVNALKMS